MQDLSLVLAHLSLYPLADPSHQLKPTTRAIQLQHATS